jgi:luciferase-like monooxygenase
MDKPRPMPRVNYVGANLARGVLARGFQRDTRDLFLTAPSMQIGIDSFAAAFDEHSRAVNPAERLRQLVQQIEHADEVGLDAFQNFATLDLLSRGRAEMIVGRGSSIEAFPLFGFRLEDYDELFAEKLDLLLNIRAHEHVQWSGAHRRGFLPDRSSIAEFRPCAGRTT